VHSVLTWAFLLLLSPVPTASVKAQNVPSGDQHKSDFFSGVVTTLESGKIAVLKTGVGKASDTRTFLITPETRVEGKLRLKARVTVRYTQDGDNMRALHIIVRPLQKK